MRKYLTKRNLGTLFGLCVISLGSVFIGYKVGEHKQFARDKSAFVDVLAFVQQQDLDDCKDVLDQEMLACVKLVEAQCSNSSPGLNYTPNVAPSAPMQKLQLHLDAPTFGGEL